nr:PREDICTED: uncharacterized protein LOC103995951 isoform X1 [Musa acuminata subsp. malaccensis]
MEIATVPSLRSHPQPCPHPWQTRAKRSGVSASKYGAVSVKPVSKGCQKCGGKGAIECPGCKVRLQSLTCLKCRKRTHIMFHAWFKVERKAETRREGSVEEKKNLNSSSAILTAGNRKEQEEWEHLREMEVL